jgi:hypothetical protein
VNLSGAGALACAGPLVRLLPSRSKEPRVPIQLTLGVDPFNYFETQNKNGDVLPLVYSWKICSILRENPQRLGFEEILKTDAWYDDGGHAEYVLRCDLLPIPPKRDSATARP